MRHAPLLALLALLSACDAPPDPTLPTGGALLVDGQPCAAGADCTSGNCSDGVCCDAPCGGGSATDCQSCLLAATGQPDGKCSPLPARKVCAADVFICQAGGFCDGTSAACGPGGLYQTPDMHLCRAKSSTNDCSIDSFCNGSGPGCRVVWQAAGTPCRKFTAGAVTGCGGTCDSAGVCRNANTPPMGGACP